MATPVLGTEARLAGSYPQFRFNQRERKLLASVLQASPYTAVAAGAFTTAGGDANEAIVISGCLASDIAIVTLKTPGATPRSVSSAAAASGQINVVMSGDPSTDHVLNYVLFRAQ